MRKNTWFRFYSEALDDPKVQRLHPTLFKAWVGILCLASEDGGKLPTNDDIAFRLRMSAHDAEQVVDELILAGLIDLEAKGRRTPHNWESRQFVSDNSTERSKKHRENKKKQECNVAETLPATPPYQTRSETDTETDPDQSARARESSEENFDHLGTGRGGSVSIDGKRSVCAKLAIGNAEPLIALYDAWPRSRTARDPDALFIATAPKLYREASPEIRAACLPLDARPAEPLPPVAPSSSLIAHLNRGKRHARTI